MLDRTDYALSDFLLFSARVYYRMFERYNGEIWPVHALGLAIGAGLVAAALKPSKFGLQLAYPALALVWLFVAWAFFLERYATINWAAVYVAPAFGLQALLLGFMAARPAARDIATAPNFSRLLALGVLIFAVVGYPLVAVVAGRPWTAAEVFGVAPDPTALATLALLAMVRGGAAAIATLIPLLWIVVTSLTLYTLGSPEMVVAPLVAALCVIAWICRRRRRR